MKRMPAIVYTVHKGLKKGTNLMTKKVSEKLTSMMTRFHYLVSLENIDL